jgi:hypothetical protein
MPTGSDSDFPPLPSGGGRKACRHRNSGEVILARNALVPGAPAPVQRNPHAGQPRAPPIFALVLTASGMGAHSSTADKAKQA